MKQKKTSFSVGFLLLVSFFQFPVRLQAGAFITYILVYLLPLIYLIINVNWLISFFRRITRDKAIAVLCFIFLMFISITYPIIHKTFDFSFLLDWWSKLFLLLIKNLFLVAVYEKYVEKDKRSIEKYATYYIYAIILYVLFSLLLIVADDLRDICLEYLYFTPKEHLDLQYPAYRTRLGWAGWSGFDVTMQCAVAVMLSQIFIIGNQRNLKKQMKYLFCSVGALVGTMLYGRTGMLASLLMIFMTFLYLSVKGNRRFAIRCLALCGVGVLSLYLISHYVEGLQVWFEWAFSIIINIVTEGRINDSVGSTQYLLNNMYWVPPLETIICGDGYFTQNGAYYMHTDSGIMRLMLYYGFGNYLVGLLASLSLMKSISKQMKIENDRVNKSDMLATFFLICICVIFFEIKGESYYKILAIILPISYLAIGGKR